MTDTIEQSLRGPDSYAHARAAIAAMEQQQIWPTPLNFEVWLHYVAAPNGPLGAEIDRLIRAGQRITDQVAEELAAQFIPKAKLNEEIRETGDKLNRQLETISVAIKTAQRSNAAYGETLEGARTELADVNEPTRLRTMVETLSLATRQVQEENGALGRRLSASTAEITRLREHLELVRKEAMTDALTLLANRKAFDEALEKACAQANARSEPMCLAVIDIDHFKRFNDTWGHQTGDQVIRFVASVIARYGEPPRVAARFGGEEFAIVLPAQTMKHVVGDLERMRREIGSRALKRRSTNEELGSVTISIGVAEHRQGDAAAVLLERADTALYASKRNGRDQVTIADNDPPTHKGGERRLGEKAA